MYASNELLAEAGIDAGQDRQLLNGPSSKLLVPVANMAGMQSQGVRALALLNDLALLVSMKPSPWPTLPPADAFWRTEWGQAMREQLDSKPFDKADGNKHALSTKPYGDRCAQRRSPPCCSTLRRRGEEEEEEEKKEEKRRGEERRGEETRISSNCRRPRAVMQLGQADAAGAPEAAGPHPPRPRVRAGQDRADNYSCPHHRLPLQRRGGHPAGWAHGSFAHGHYHHGALDDVYAASRPGFPDQEVRDSRRRRRRADGGCAGYRRSGFCQRRALSAIRASFPPHRQQQICEGD